MLDLTSLEKACNALRVSLDVYSESPLPEYAREKVVFRDGVIQRFEFTFELSWKMIKRYLKEYGLEKPDALNNRELFRVAHEQGLIDNPEKWFVYLKARNMTSHTYDDSAAAEVFESATAFATDSKKLLAKLKEKCV